MLHTFYNHLLFVGILILLHYTIDLKYIYCSILFLDILCIILLHTSVVKKDYQIECNVEHIYLRHFLRIFLYDVFYFVDFHFLHLSYMGLGRLDFSGPFKQIQIWCRIYSPIKTRHVEISHRPHVVLSFLSPFDFDVMRI